MLSHKCRNINTLDIKINGQAIIVTNGGIDEVSNNIQIASTIKEGDNIQIG